MVICNFFPPQTGLTPLMEAASGGYYEVGKVLINKVRLLGVISLYTVYDMHMYVDKGS